MLLLSFCLDRSSAYRRTMAINGLQLSNTASTVSQSCMHQAEPARVTDVGRCTESIRELRSIVR
jgi:hypothetical protein